MFAVDRRNPWIEASSLAPRQPPAWLVVAVAMAGAVLVIRVAVRLSPTISSLVWTSGPPSPWLGNLRTLLGQLALYWPLLFAALAGGAWEGRSVLRLGQRPLAWVPAGLALGAGGISLSLGVAWLAGAVIRGPGAAPGPPLWGPLAADTVTALFAVFVEEVYFRGWLQPRLGARWGPWGGLLAASALFAVLHMFGGQRSVLAVLNIFLAGMLFGLLALRSGGLIAPCAAHFAWNWCEGNLFGSDPNPGTGPFGAFFDLDLRGPALWSGGAQTMNGSLATTLVLGAMVLALSFLAPTGSAAGAGYRSGRAP